MVSACLLGGVMDPQKCWDEIKEILVQGQEDDWDRDDLVERLECLAEWIRKGGYWPKT